MKITSILLIFLLLNGCNRPLTKEENDFANAIFATVLIIGGAYLIHESLKDGGSGGYNPLPLSDPVCTQKVKQGTCSHHHGIHVCKNYKIICRDGTESPSQAPCESSFCKYDHKRYQYED